MQYIVLYHLNFFIRYDDISIYLIAKLSFLECMDCTVNVSNIYSEYISTNIYLLTYLYLTDITGLVYNIMYFATYKILYI